MIKRLLKSKQGVTAVEFAIIATPLIALLFGTLELGYQAYAITMVQGTTYAAARQATLENATEAAVRAYIHDQLKGIAKPEDITLEASAFRDYNKVGQPEKITTDKNGNGRYDKADLDCFIDDNGNNRYDVASQGKAGIGGAEDVVRFKVDVSYKRLTPITSLLGLSDKVEISRTTFMRNEPYAGVPAPEIRCGV